MGRNSTLHALVWAIRHARKRLLPPEWDAVNELLTPCEWVIDVGAHAGSWAVSLARRYPGTRVLAVEALPYYALCLRKTLSLLRLKNVEIAPVALSSSSGVAEVVWCSPTGTPLTGRTHLRAPLEDASEGITVPRTTLDELLTELSSVAPSSVGFLKVDVEGVELDVLEGAEGTVRRYRPLILVETNPANYKRYGRSPSELLEWAKQHGYEPVSPESLTFYDHSTTVEGGPQLNDLLLIPKNRF